MKKIKDKSRFENLIKEACEDYIEDLKRKKIKKISKPKNKR